MTMNAWTSSKDSTMHISPNYIIQFSPSYNIFTNSPPLHYQEQIFERLSLGAKETRFGADSGQKYEDLVQKYEAYHQKAWHGPCLQWHGRATTTALLLLLLLL
ncbi:hypothetical protein MTR_7g051170 [Medicago truncatula]|uniref:Uncharacterized protein n=1 Tax=Medicago truncatula TaxID=3880 RepID=G7KWY1_MEDTR|nr:hypothetical protein MTR_7g051170 [Medicago truncatula]